MSQPRPRPQTLRLTPIPGQLVVAEFFFEVPLDYTDPHGPTLQLFARAATKHAPPLDPADVPPPPQDPKAVFSRPWLLYLEGGPGFGNKEPQDNALTRLVLARGYQVLYLDYRGTGLSTPVHAHGVVRLGPPPVQAEYLRRFRADNIVRDCEAVRMCLTAHHHPDHPPAAASHPHRPRWSLFGQSYGGFVALTYLSHFPDSLREVFLTGGLAPVGVPPAAVYQATYARVERRNREYFAAFPEDRATLQHVAMFLAGEPDGALALPGGGKLTFPRVLTLGNALGMHGGPDMVHAVVLRMKSDLMQAGIFTRATLKTLEDFLPLDTCPIHAILHEAIYCGGKGVASRWAAFEVGAQLTPFRWLRETFRSQDVLGDDLYFSGGVCSFTHPLFQDPSPPGTQQNAVKTE